MFYRHGCDRGGGGGEGDRCYLDGKCREIGNDFDGSGVGYCCQTVVVLVET